MIIQQAGGANPFSYTATADLVITSYATTSASQTRLGTYVGSTSGVNGFLAQGDGGVTAGSNYNKTILLSGQTITQDNPDVVVYGVIFSGFEL